MTLYINDILIEKNLTHSSCSPRITTTATTLNGNLTLTVDSNFLHSLSGTATGYSITLPDATTLTNGWKYELWNETSQSITIRYSGGAIYLTMPPESFAIVTLENNATISGLWLSYRAFTGEATGIRNYNVTASVAFTSTSTVDVLITGMSVTPQAGTYAVWFNSSLEISGSNQNNYITVYNGATAITATLRRVKSTVSAFFGVHSTISTMGIEYFNGTSICGAYARRSGGTSFTHTDRTLLLIRLGD